MKTSQPELDKKKAKGVPSETVETEIQHSHYAAVLQTHKSQVNSFVKLQSRDHCIYMLAMKKTSLSIFDNKRFWLPDNLASLPLGHYKIADYVPPPLRQTAITDYFAVAPKSAHDVVCDDEDEDSTSASSSESAEESGGESSSASGDSSDASPAPGAAGGVLSKYWARVPAPAPPAPPSESSLSTSSEGDYLAFMHTFTTSLSRSLLSDFVCNCRWFRWRRRRCRGGAGSTLSPANPLQIAHPGAATSARGGPRPLSHAAEEETPAPGTQPLHRL